MKSPRKKHRNISICPRTEPGAFQQETMGDTAKGYDFSERQKKKVGKVRSGIQLKWIKYENVNCMKDLLEIKLKKDLKIGLLIWEFGSNW